MKERPILFNGEGVRAILDGRKAQTRRVIKPQPALWDFLDIMFLPRWTLYGETWKSEGTMREEAPLLCPYGILGDRLWIRETWSTDVDIDSYAREGELIPVHYRADPLPEGYEDEAHFLDVTGAEHWSPSIHMPRWACRVVLEVTGVRVERVQEIMVDDVAAEGTPGMIGGRYQCTRCNSNGWSYNYPDGCPYCDGTGLNHKEHYQRLWDSIYVKRGYGWDMNPWVWGIEFKMVHE